MNKQRVQAVRNHPDCKIRTMVALTDALIEGVDINDEKELRARVEAAYKVGKPRTQHYINKKFENAYSWLKKQDFS